MMKNILLLVIILFFNNANSQQIKQEKYSKVKIDLLDKEFTDLARLGLEVDHGIIVKDRYLINDYSTSELNQIKNANFNYEIIIDDVVSWYQDQNRDYSKVKAAAPPPSDCFNSMGSQQTYETPVNYEYGSMGGYLTYQEYLNTLDSMFSKFPNLITQKAAIGTVNDTTWRGNPILWVKISDNPNIDETESEVLFTSLHHAREPNSLAQNIFYMWYLLENYSTDAEVQYLVDNTEIYFIPMVNPDGYIMNQENNPTGGGMIRKNGRDNNSDGLYSTSIDGVDLNRNYGYEWAYDDTGSSPSMGSQTYRGPSAFSEPETQAVRDFCNLHEFQITLNYHTYGNLLIHPWGYTDVITSEHESFRMLGLEMTQYNNFTFGTGTETVGYIVNGDSDDWMYGETVSKAKIYSLTPEVGNGFWPAQTDIDDLNKSVMHQNLSVSRLVLNYVEAIEENANNIIDVNSGNFDFTFIKKGLKIGNTTVDISSLSSGLTLTFSPLILSLNHLDSQSYSVPFVVDGSVVNNDELKILISIDNGLYIYYDTITKIYNSISNVNIFDDNTNDLSNWNTSNWFLTTSEYHTAPNCITESPDASYGSFQNKSITLDPVDLTQASSATISFWAKWNIEKGYDFTEIQISTDGTSFVPLCGKYSSEGTSSQDFGMPLYDGVQNTWVEELIDVSDYLGNVLHFRFQFKSDNFVVEDGFYFDDFKINIEPHTHNTINTQYSCSEEDTGSATIIHTNNWGLDSTHTEEVILAETYNNTQTQYTTDNDDVGTSVETFASVYGCDSTVTTNTLLDSTINVVEFENTNILVYPNPVKNILFVDLENNEKDIEFAIFNSVGKQINSFIVEKNKKNYTYDFSNYSNGLYIIKLQVANKSKIIKILKK